MIVFASSTLDLTTDPVRLLSAVVVALTWAIASGSVLWRHHVRTRRAEAIAQHVAEDPIDVSPLLVVFASQTGNAEDLARATSEALQSAGAPATLVDIRHLTVEVLRHVHRVLFVASTTGEGDPPDGAERFVRTAMAAPVPLPELAYGILALGDRSYDQYCAFGFALESWLQSCGARALFPTIDVDDNDDTALQTWRTQVATLGASSADWNAPTFAAFQLESRTLLNAGSPGGPAFRVTLRPPADVSWQAGDILVVQADSGDGQVREYSIASAPDEGRIELLVRQVRTADGSLGVGSGWLTARAPLGALVTARIRENTSFRAPEAPHRAILIGNGTGLAGLRAHLAARGHTSEPAWLLFGERTAAHDVHFRDDLEGWRGTGRLARFDAAFSRDAGDGRYVQDLIRQAPDDVRAWVEAGAVIYVCGSRVGMADGVHAALVDVLGESVLTQLAEAGRYRRDVY